MPAWTDYKAEATARGALAHEVFVVQSAPTGDMDLVRATLPDHLAYLARMEASGALVMAGPVSDLSGDNMEGAGMLIYSAKSFEDAQALAANDPMHVAGARSFTLRRWLINEGGLTLTVRLSGQSVALGKGNRAWPIAAISGIC